MKYAKFGLVLVLGVVLGIMAAIDFASRQGARPVAVFADPRLAQLDAQAEADQKLGQYSINMMYRSFEGKKLSDGKKLVLSRAIVRVSNEIFEDEEHKRAFIAALAIESQFNRMAQSPTGPKGYAQLARKSFHEALETCGVTNVNDDDVWETDLNLYAGACYFRMMLEMPEVGGDPYIAIVAYNQGPYSKDLKSYAKNGSLEGIEPLRYVAKFAFLKRTTTDAKEVGVPAIHEIPKPTGPNNSLKTPTVSGKVKTGQK